VASDLRDYAVVTASYWAFTLTDGAVRMLVLLHLNAQGYAPLAIVTLFLFYEFFGVVTNLVGGWVGARFGLRSTLLAGLALQIVACLLLRSGALMVAQALCGIAKDLTKMSSKSYIKLVAPEGGLLRWVSILTGSKNALKGAGFFLGGLLLSWFDFEGAAGAMALALALALISALLLLPRAPSTSAKWPFKSIFSHDARIQWLSAARFFLFGARDVWFVLALPVFLADELGWSFAQVGGVLALWVIGYGVVQALAPLVLSRDASPGSWTALLLLPLGSMLAALRGGAPAAATLAIGLAAFGILFAATSALHSYLVVAYAGKEKVALAVGFYYMANAGGRLAGTVLSGAIYQVSGLPACLAAAMVFVALAWLASRPLRPAAASGG